MREKIMLEFQSSYRPNQADLRMRSKTSLLLGILLSVSLAHALAAAESKVAPAGLSAAQIADKHVAARGGLQAWRAVQTLSVSGKLDAGSGDSVERSARLAREGMGARVKRAERAAAADSVKAAAAQQVQLPFRLAKETAGRA